MAKRFLPLLAALLVLAGLLGAALAARGSRPSPSSPAAVIGGEAVAERELDGYTARALVEAAAAGKALSPEDAREAAFGEMARQRVLALEAAALGVSPNPDGGASSKEGVEQDKAAAGEEAFAAALDAAGMSEMEYGEWRADWFSRSLITAALLERLDDEFDAAPDGPLSEQVGTCAGEPVLRSEWNYYYMRNAFEALDRDGAFPDPYDEASAEEASDAVFAEIERARGLSAWAAENGVSVSDAEVKAEADRISAEVRSRLGSLDTPEGMASLLSDFRLSETELARRTRGEARADAISKKIREAAAPGISVSEAEARAWHERNKASFDRSTVSAMRIFCGNEAAAKAVVDVSGDADSEGEFLAVAEKLEGQDGIAGWDDTGPVTRKEAGENADALFSAPLCRASGPVLTPSGWAAVFVYAKDEKPAPSFSSVREEAEKAALEEKTDEAVSEKEKEAALLAPSSHGTVLTMRAAYAESLKEKYGVKKLI